MKAARPTHRSHGFSTGSARPSAPATTADAPIRRTSIGIKRYIFFHGKRHPAEMGAPEVTAFLTFLAVHGKVAASTQNQALSALLFLYREVLGVELPWLDIVRAKRPQHLPVVLTRDEVRAVLQRLDGVPRLMALLLYSAGLRLLECCRLRVKDVDFGYSPEDWRRLEADLRSQHLSKDATSEEGTSYGQKYVIRATLVGPSGRSADVVSLWVVRRGDEFPRFVTAYPEGDR